MSNFMQGRSIPGLSIGIILLLILQACISTSTTPASNFYLLSVRHDLLSSSPVSSNYNDMHIGIGPVTLPDYLDRSQIVIRSDTTQLYLAQLHRWAEPLDRNFIRVLAEYISSSTGSEKIIILPSRDRAELDIQIIIDVIQFDSNSNGDAVLIAYWSVESSDGSKLVDNKKSTVNMRVDRPGDYDTVVQTLSQLIGLLAGEITAELNN